MTPPGKLSATAGKLRLQAEHLLTRTRREVAEMPLDDVQKLVHELQVHQIELEMQNDELRRTQLELEAARERLRLPYDAAPVGFFTLDAQGVIQEANLAAARLLNFDRVKLTGRKLMQFIAPESQDVFYLRRRQLFSTGEKQTCELHLLRIGSSKFVARLEAVMDSAGQEPSARCLAMVSDITDQKRAEESLKQARDELEARVKQRTQELTSINAALRRSEQHLASFFQLAPISLAWLSAGGTVLRSNQAQLDLLGCSESEFLGHSFPDFCVESAQAGEMLRRLAARETIRNLRLANRRKDGAIRHILVDAVALWSDQQFQYSAVFSRDITDRVNLEREVLHISEREQRSIAQDLHDGLGQLLAGAAYLAGTVRQDLAAKSRREARKLDRVLDLITEAISQTRNLARGLHPVEPEPNGLMSALDSLAARTKKLFHVRCHFTCRQPVLIQDNTVATHLFRIAQEAVTNAIKHGQPRRIEISLTETPGRINLAINDDGSGNPEGHQNPAGMGLRIMRYRAGMIGGSFVLQKGPGGGTTVVCTVHVPPETSRRNAPVSGRKKAKAKAK